VGDRFPWVPYDKPRETHFELRRRQAARVVAPSDEGLIESEPILGALVETR
jgi:hypothetical protein